MCVSQTINFLCIGVLYFNFSYTIGERRVSIMVAQVKGGSALFSVQPLPICPWLYSVYHLYQNQC